MKKLFIIALIGICYAKEQIDKKELAKDMYEEAKKDLEQSVTKTVEELKESDLYAQAAKIGVAVDEFHREYPWIIPGIMAPMAFFRCKKLILLASPLIYVGVSTDLERGIKKISSTK